MEAITEPRKLALEISRIITEDEKRWNQNYWTDGWPLFVSAETARESLQEEDCGSTCCVAGWAAILSAPAGTAINNLTTRTTVVFPDHDSSPGIASIAQKALSLNDKQASWLFNGCRTREQVLITLEKIAAGEDWNPPWHY